MAYKIGKRDLRYRTWLRFCQAQDMGSV